MKRRDFIKTTGAAAAATAIAPSLLKGKPVFDVIPNDEVFAVPKDNIIIILELFGGNDGMNTVIPADNPEYYNLRPTLAIPKELCDAIAEPKLYLHPALSANVVNDGFKQLFLDGSLAVVQNIGFKPANMSHFRAQDIWLSGINSSDASEPLLEGWLGRFLAMRQPNFPLEIPAHPVALQIGGTLSLLFKSQKGDMGIAINDIDRFYELSTGLTPMEDLMPGENDYQNEFNFVHVIAQQCEMYANEVKNAYDKGIKEINESNYTGGLAQKFKTISALIQGGLETQIYYVNLSNFDSHAQQQNEITMDEISGQHPTLLKEIADGISGLMADAKNLQFDHRIIGMTMSEFGRRAYDNGSRGTDHGAASMQFVFGGHEYVNAANYGGEVKLEEDDLDENGNLQMEIDYRRTFAEFLRKWLGATENEIEDVFMTGSEVDLSDVGVINPRATSVGSLKKLEGSNELLIYPNPGRGAATLAFENKLPGRARIQIFDLKGGLVKNVESAYFEAGRHTIPLFIETPGAYICSVKINGRQYVTNMSVIK